MLWHGRSYGSGSRLPKDNMRHGKGKCCRLWPPAFPRSSDYIRQYLACSGSRLPKDNMWHGRGKMLSLMATCLSPLLRFTTVLFKPVTMKKCWIMTISCIGSCKNHFINLSRKLLYLIYINCFRSHLLCESINHAF